MKSSCLCPPFFCGKVCEKIISAKSTCRNGGLWRNEVFGCLCSPGYGGQTCQSKMCEVNDPEECVNEYKGLCNKLDVYIYCPVKYIIKDMRIKLIKIEIKYKLNIKDYLRKIQKNNKYKNRFDYFNEYNDQQNIKQTRIELLCL